MSFLGSEVEQPVNKLQNKYILTPYIWQRSDAAYFILNVVVVNKTAQNSKN